MNRNSGRICFLLMSGMLLLGFLTSAVANAQTVNGQFFRKLELGLFYPSYLERDSPLIANELGLSDVERALVEEIINQYIIEFEAESTRVQEALEKAGGASAVELPDMVERENIRSRARVQMKPSGDPIRLNLDREAMAERRARAVGIIREEMALEEEEPVPDSNRSLLIQEWSERRQVLQNELLNKFDLVKGVDQSHWEAVNRALRRINTSWPNLLRGEEIDIVLLLSDHFGKNSSIYQDLAPYCLEYAIEYDAALQSRNDILTSTTPSLLDARDRTQLEKAISLGTAQIQARAALVDVNRRWVLRFMELLKDEEAKESFRAYASMKMYPDAHYGDPPVATIDYLLQAGMSEGDIGDALRALKEEYLSEREAWRLIAIEVIPMWDRDRLMQELESNTVALAYNGWLDGISSRRSSLPAWRKHLYAGIQLDKDYGSKIRGLVGLQAYEAIPGRYRSARRPDSLRGPVPGAKRTANVVYWTDVMKDHVTTFPDSTTK
ncbi:MAG: hypothetical protein VX527_12435 [Planctomycetota bacterium]|nr:hypothetical protein [Planctomycetota bacterium]